MKFLSIPYKCKITSITACKSNFYGISESNELVEWDAISINEKGIDNV